MSTHVAKCSNTLTLGLKPDTFELVCVPIAVETASCIAAVVYRPSSAALSSQFFAELDDLMDRLATFVDPTHLLDWSTDPLTVQLVDMLTSHGFTNRVTSATHNLGGLLDVVVTVMTFCRHLSTYSMLASMLAVQKRMTSQRR